MRAIAIAWARVHRLSGGPLCRWFFFFYSVLFFFFRAILCILQMNKLLMFFFFFFCSLLAFSARTTNTHTHISIEKKICVGLRYFVECLIYIGHRKPWAQCNSSACIACIRRIFLFLCVFVQLLCDVINSHTDCHRCVCVCASLHTPSSGSSVKSKRSVRFIFFNIYNTRDCVWSSCTIHQYTTPH